MLQEGLPAISIYSEETPNPETMKFVVNKLLYPGKVADFTTKEEAHFSPLADTLFNFPFVRRVFIASNFVTLTKTKDFLWQNIIPQVLPFLRDYLEEGRPVMDSSALKTTTTESRNEGTDLISKIKSTLDSQVKPVVEMDGGAILFEDYQDGILTVSLHGACNECPSSMKTLKKGVEAVMKRNFPEIKEVKAAK